MANSSLFLSLR